jgi:hypothetical protein
MGMIVWYLDLHLKNWGVLHGYDRVVGGFTSEELRGSPWV